MLQIAPQVVFVLNVDLVTQRIVLVRAPFAKEMSIYAQVIVDPLVMIVILGNVLVQTQRPCGIFIKRNA